MNLLRKMLVPISLFAIFQILDLVTTAIGGIYYESNRLAAATWLSHGFGALILCKFLQTGFIFLMFAIAYQLGRSYRRVFNVGMLIYAYVLCVFQFLVVANNVLVLWRI